jgi:uncharacterized phage infection (PIP) family protein YhgE
MSTSPTLPPVQTSHAVNPRERRRWPRQIGVVAAIIVALLIGVGIGTAANSQTSQLNSANAKLATANSKVSSLQGQVSTMQSQVQQAQATARNATALANQKASIAWTTRNAQLNQKAATLRQQQASLNAQTGQVAANSISQDGVYVIGKDIKSGVWHTANSGGSQCYYAKLGSTDTSNILDNNNITGPATVDLSGAYAFDISGGCTWVKTG